MRGVTVDDLPEAPLAAAALFQQHWLAHVEGLLAGGEDVLVVFPRGDYRHGEWRRTVIAELARARAPRRVNGASGEGAALEALATYLAGAPGVTGQYLEAGPQ